MAGARAAPPETGSREIEEHKPLKLSTAINEKESPVTTITDVVTSMREYDERLECRFAKHAGELFAPQDGSMQEKLRESITNKTPVEVHYNQDTSQITNVLRAPATSGSGKPGAGGSPTKSPP
ncbi:MAG: hypothetical protein C5B49_04160 [Bdellovibrio sp.]|nr:MAG: hypothetical protein C5B49_04160 [Bdellovibrio sp.]